tara:strand:- start:98 stop:256 length:159 start_codon:yes stop_codon:yes gene_type:complete
MDKSDIFESIIMLSIIAVVMCLSFCSCTSKTSYSRPIENIDKIVYGNKNIIK